MTNRQNRKDKKQSKQPAPVSVLQFDLDLLLASQQTDVLADREWFLAHPGLTERDRPASLLERAAQGLPPGTRVLVVLLDGGMQGRVFYTPDDAEE